MASLEVRSRGRRKEKTIPGQGHCAKRRGGAFIGISAPSDNHSLQFWGTARAQQKVSLPLSYQAKSLLDSRWRSGAVWRMRRGEGQRLRGGMGFFGGCMSLCFLLSTVAAASAASKEEVNAEATNLCDVVCDCSSPEKIDCRYELTIFSFSFKGFFANKFSSKKSGYIEPRRRLLVCREQQQRGRERY